MNNSAHNADRLLDLAEAVCDESASEADRAELDAMLVGNQEARQQYLEYCRLHISLRLQLRANRAAQKACRQINVAPILTSPGEFDVAIGDTSTSASRGICPVAFTGAVGDFFSSGWPVAYLLATVIVGIGFFIGSLAYVSQSVQTARRSTPMPVGPSSDEVPFVGRVTNMSDDCQWTDRKTATIRYAHVPLGRKYALASGLMEITYDSGAKVILQGPCTYVVESRTGGNLALGG